MIEAQDLKASTYQNKIRPNIVIRRDTYGMTARTNTPMKTAIITPSMVE
jgi:hypothetical protein